MSAVELISRASNAGVTLSFGNGGLLLRADCQPPAELLAELAAHKLEIIEVLASPQPLPASAWLWLLLMNDGEIIQHTNAGMDQRGMERLAKRDYGGALAQVVPMPGLTHCLTGSELERYRAGLPIVRTPAPTPTNLWLARVARHLGVRPNELMHMGLLTDDDVTECAGADPAEVAALIRLNPAWINRAQPFEHGAHRLQWVDQHDGAPQHPIQAAVTASPEWLAARNAFYNHLMPCRACHAPVGRYCPAGAELRQRYDATEIQPTLLKPETKEHAQ